MWYVIQVATGKEEEIKGIIDKNVEHNCCQCCFCLKRERVWRRGGACIVHVEQLFPGYVFIETDTPGKIYTSLKDVLQFTKLLKSEDNIFLSVEQEEQEFLMKLVNGDRDFVVRLSEVVVDQEKNIVAVEGPLAQYADRIVKKKLRLRYVVVRVMLLGEEREVLIGIKVREVWN